MQQLRFSGHDRQRCLNRVAAPIRNAGRQQNIGRKLRAYDFAVRHIFVHGVCNGTHPNLVAAVAYADRRNAAALRLLHDVVDLCAPLTEILAQHVVIGAARRHAGAFNGDHRFRRKRIKHAQRVDSRFIVVQRKSLRDGDAAKALVARRSLRFVECYRRESGRAKRCADRVEQRRVADDDGNRVEAITQRACKCRDTYRAVRFADLGRHPGARQRACDQDHAVPGSERRQRPRRRGA